MAWTVVALFVLGIVLLVAGAEVLVRGASRLAALLGVSPLVIGLTVVAFGTSTPELAVTVQSSLSGQAGADIALGNVVGSNIFNVLLILGLSALVAPLVVAQRLVQVEVPLMIVVSVAVLVLAANGSLGRWEGLLLFGGVVVYTAVAIRSGRREARSGREEGESSPASPSSRRWAVAGSLVLASTGLAMLVLGSRWLVTGALAMARALGVGELVVGLTIVAAGTSLPELATSVVASVRGERDIAVGNVVGSNLFNLLAVLGVAALVAPGGVAVAPAAVRFDIPVMIAVAVACLPIFFTGHAIARWEGALFLALYGAYTAFLILAASHHRALGPFSAAMMLFVAPLVLVTLGVSCARELRARRRPPGTGARDVC